MHFYAFSRPDPEKLKSFFQSNRSQLNPKPNQDVFFDCCFFLAHGRGYPLRVAPQGAPDTQRRRRIRFEHPHARHGFFGEYCSHADQQWCSLSFSICRRRGMVGQIHRVPGEASLFGTGHFECRPHGADSL